MSVHDRDFDVSEEIEAAERTVDVAAAAMDAARDRMDKAAEALRQAQSNLVIVQEKHGIPVPEWPEHWSTGHRWWAARIG
jgi:hypothetical protein